MEGPYTVTIKFAGRDIPRSPFSVGVKGMAGDPTKVTASGPGLDKSGVTVKKKTFFEVHTKSKSLILN
jgi:filamin